jgi:hypothetical protein
MRTLVKIGRIQFLPGQAKCRQEAENKIAASVGEKSIGLDFFCCTSSFFRVPQL